jgi:hypothetical protein
MAIPEANANIIILIFSQSNRTDINNGTLAKYAAKE